MNRLVDENDRRRAVTDFATNLVVTAGAGTGKTSLLIERILNGCLGERIDLDSLVGITFTEKAAAEMRDRLSFALEEILAIAAGRKEIAAARSAEATRSFAYLRDGKGLATGEIVARARNALKRLDDCVVGTIHSLCADLMRRYPREAGIDPAFRVDEGPAQTRLGAEVWEQWLAEELGAGGERLATWRKVLRRVPPAVLEEMAMSLAQGPVNLDPAGIDAQGSRTLETLKHWCRDTAGEIEVAERQATGMRANMEKHLAVCREFLLRVAAGGPGVATGEIPYPTGTVPKAGRKLTGVAAGDLEELAGRARKLLEDCSLIDPMAGLLIELLLPFAEHFRAQLAIEGFVSFDELLLRTRDLLRDNRQVRQKEKGRIRSLLVDEFQDTNPLQYEIVFFLSEIPDDFDRDAYETRLEPGKLFIVGDPKQSIYRFRGADIEAYMDAVRRIEAGGGEILTLVSNFRSPAEILDPLNRMFQVAFGRPGPAQPEYAAISAARGNAADSPRVRIWSVPSEGEKEPAGKGRRRQGRVIAEWIGRTVVAGGLAYRDIALLFRAMTDVNLYLRPLREAGIPFVVEGGKVFGRKPEVREFLSLLRLLVNPNDGVALLAVLRSPLGGAADTELARHAAAGGRWNLDASTDPGPCPNLARTLKDLRDLRERIAGYPADRAVRCVLEDTHLLEFNAAAYEGTQRVVNLWKIADRVAHRARNDHLSLESTVRSLEREFAAEELEDPESPLADEALDAVRVLTVHKAKGLEFPVVIVPDLARRARYGDDSGAGIGWLGTGKGRKAVAVQIGSGPDKRYNPAAVIHRQTYRLHADAERIRALYVACTRAKETLILVASASTTAPWMKCLAAWEYRWEGGEPPPATRFYHDQVGHEPMIPSGAQPAVKSHVPDGEAITDATARFETARKQAEAHRHRRWIRTPSGLREELERDQDPERPANSLPRLPQPIDGEDAAPVRTAAAAGIAVHRLLQIWDRRDPGWLREQTKEAAAAGALQTGTDRREVESLVGKILDRFLASDLPRRLQEADLIGREIPFEGAEEGILMRGMIDLVYRRGDEVVVADFKTDAISSGEEEELLVRYQDQLAAYGRAVERALGMASPATLEIWSIRTGRIVAYPRGKD